MMEGRPGFVHSPWCEAAKCEADIKAETQATIRNIPIGYDEAPAHRASSATSRPRVGLVREGLLTRPRPRTDRTSKGRAPVRSPPFCCLLKPRA